MFNAFDNDQNKNTIFFPMPVRSLADINKKGKRIIVKLPLRTQTTLTL